MPPNTGPLHFLLGPSHTPDDAVGNCYDQKKFGGWRVPRKPQSVTSTQESLYYSNNDVHSTVYSHSDTSLNCCERLRARVAHIFREWRAVLHKDPRIIILPIMLLVMLTTLGVTGVVVTSNMQSQFVQQEARNLALDLTGALESLLNHSSMPASALAAFVKLHKNYSDIQRDFANVSDQLLQQTGTNRTIRSLQLAPGGVIQLQNPQAGNEKAQGFNLFDLSHNQSKDALRAVTSRKLTLTGPFMLTQGFEGVVVRLPIFIPGNEKSLYFPLGNDLLQEPIDCEGCKGPDGSLFWGFACVVLSKDEVLKCAARVHTPRERGYQYRLTRPKDPDKTCMQDAIVVASNTDEPLQNPQCQKVMLPNAVWTFCLAPTGGWMVPWLWPLLAMAVVAAAALSLLSFAVAVSRRQHQLLLQTMLPSKVIRHLKTIQHFVESFPMVTILFSDIVGFDDWVEERSPEEVVRLLDEVYSLYDVLVDKHKVYKVETIGDAFMCVGGCPEKEDPASSAARIAAMAMDMLRATRELVTSGGHRIGIRVGIASGPVVAAVIGDRMPRYCLFGDTVNTASRMETSSRPLCIHVSPVTADLLQQWQEREGTKKLDMELACRGQVHIKGKGPMTTYWVCPPDGVQPPSLPYEAASVATSVTEDWDDRSLTPSSAAHSRQLRRQGSSNFMPPGN